VLQRGAVPLRGCQHEGAVGSELWGRACKGRPVDLDGFESEFAIGK